jgi:hypothetical protein
MIYTASHHAVLFALLARAVLVHCREERGEQIVRRAVRRYGEQRGQRMRLRAERDGEPLTMLNYMAYGEWRASEGESEQRMGETTPDAYSYVNRCPWNQAWVESDLLHYGRLYCQEIDLALVRGFNPQLKLGVLSTLANGGKPCEFIFYQAELTPENLVVLGKKKAANELKGAVMSWDYHLGHLYQAVKAVVTAELGSEGETVLLVALDEFARRYGEEAVQMILSYQMVDFDRLPA